MGEVRTDQTRAKVTWNPGYADEWRWLYPREDGRPWAVGDTLPNPAYKVIAIKPEAKRCRYNMVVTYVTHPFSFNQCEGIAIPGHYGCKRKGHDRGAL